MDKAMEQNDTFYRAFLSYQKEFLGNKDNAAFQKAVFAKKDTDDFLLMTETEVKIDEDWILAIEKGLVYIGKAIREERQFIRNNGEVLPIEKIRSVSKDSVADLAKHSDYITRLPENEEDPLIPDKLFMVRRESEYAVYENRVVYTALDYLKDFVTSRLMAITEASNLYEGKCSIKKSLIFSYRHLDFTLTLAEKRENDPIAIEKNKQNDLIRRINSVLEDIILLLRRPLMQEVSKAPKVKRPIVKTNVLKMDVNFKESLALYDFVSSYPKPGYTITRSEKKIAPFPEEISNKLAQIVGLSSFLTYMINNAIEPTLQANFLAEEKRRKAVSDQAILEEIAALLGKAKESGKPIGEYLLLLENGYKILQEKVETAKKELADVVASYEAKIAALNAAHEKAMKEAEEKHQRILDSIIADHEKEIAELKAAHEKEMAELKAKHEAEIAALNAAHEQELETTKAALEEEKRRALEEKDKEFALKESELQSRIAELSTKTAAQDAAIAQLTKERDASLGAEAEAKRSCAEQIAKASEEKDEAIAKASEEVRLAKAELTSLRVKSGASPAPEDFSSRERFLELEEEKKTLDAFFDLAWKQTKKSIRHSLFQDNPYKKKK